MSIIPANPPKPPGGIFDGLVESLYGITEIDTEAFYRVMTLGDSGTNLVRAIKWSDHIARVLVRTETGEEFEVPSIRLEKLSPLEVLGGQAE